MSKAQHFACNLFNEIRVRKIGPQERDITLQLGAHGLEALDLKLQNALTLQQSITRLEAVAALQGVMGEVGR